MTGSAAWLGPAGAALEPSGPAGRGPPGPLRDMTAGVSTWRDGGAGIAVGRAAGAGTVIGVGERTRSARPDLVVRDPRESRWNLGRLEVACRR